MKDVFECVYNGVIEATETLCEFAVELFYALVAALAIITFPLWLLPYHFYKNLKKGDVENDTTGSDKKNKRP